MYIVELESGVWLTDTDGDPGRTLVKKNAKKFSTMREAVIGLSKARKYRPFKDACIQGEM